MLFDTDARLAHDVTTALWRRAVAITRDPDFALRALELVDIRVLGARPDASEYLMLQLFAASANIGDALARLARAYPVVDDGVSLDLTHDHGRIRLRYIGRVGEELPPAFVLFQLGMWARTLNACAIDAPSSVM